MTQTRNTEGQVSKKELMPGNGVNLPLQFSDLKLESGEVVIPSLKEVSGYNEVRYRDAIYMGIVSSGKRHGKGVMKYPNGR